MRKILIIAKREYRAMVATKAFLVVLTMMPVLMGGAILVQGVLHRYVGLDEKAIVVLDGTGVLFAALQESAEQYNAHATTDPDTGKQVKPRYRLERSAADEVDDELRLALSQRIRDKQIDAFVEIPAEVLDGEAAEGAAAATFYGQNPALSAERHWLHGALNGAVRTHRLMQHGIEPQLVDRATAPVALEGLELFEQSEAGEIVKAEPKSRELAVFLPFGIMMLMFMVILLAAQPMLESVLEEKSQRIAEVLLGSATPFQLMAGKLLGSVAGSFTVVAVYASGALGLAWHYDVLHLVPLRIVPWFLVFQVLAVLLFSSLFLAVGAAVNHIKEAQSMLMPVWLVIVIPMFVWFNVVRDPTGSFATWMSFVPPATPLLMVLRMAASSAVPIWQPLLGIVLLLGTTLLGVFAAGRVFRIGILTQGKTPKLSELLRWIAAG